MRLENRIAVVTGAARGIGFAIARRYLDEGATVVMTDIAEPDQDVAQLQSGHGARARWLALDVRSEEAIARTMGAVAEEFGRIDVLVNNAGVEFYKPVTSTTESEWDGLMAVNLRGVFLCSKHAIPHMPPGSAIVHMASELGLVAEANVAAYCASKGGVLMLTKAMAVDHGAAGIRVNCICPGPVETELLESVFRACDDGGALRRSFEKRILLGRLGMPDEVAKAAVFLASDDASFMTGASLILDGGWTAH